MSIKTVYIKAKSKAAVNRDLAEGKKIVATEFNMGGTSTHSFEDLPNGTVVKIFEKVISGSPFAKAYGNVKNGKLV